MKLRREIVALILLYRLLWGGAGALIACGLTDLVAGDVVSLLLYLAVSVLTCAAACVVESWASPRPISNYEPDS